MVHQGIRDMTSNPTISQTAVTAGDASDEQLREVLEHETDPREVFLSCPGGHLLGMRQARRDLRARRCEPGRMGFARG